MKATLKFNLPDEEFDLTTALNGSQYLFLIKDTLEEIRSKLKYTQLTDEQIKVYESIRDFIYTWASERDINLEIG